MTDLTVPVTTHIPGPLYRTLEAEARKSRRRVSDLLVEHAAQSLQVQISIDQPQRTWVRMTVPLLYEAAELYSKNASQVEIAKALGCSRSTIRNHWNRITHLSRQEQAA